VRSAIKSFLRNYWVLAILVLIKFFLQYSLVNPVYELQRDEYLHLDQAFHLAAGYISVPPFTSWISKIIYLLGGGVFWIRFFPALFGAMTIITAWLIVAELDGRLWAKILTSSFLIFSILMRINVLYQPNSFDFLVWTMVFYGLIRYLKTEKSGWFIFLAIIIALGVYNKYNVLFLLIGLFVGIGISRQRIIYKRKALYLALVLCLIMLLPNIIWQIKNHFPVIHHFTTLSKTQLVHVKRLDFLIDQVKFSLIGSLTILAFWALIFYKPFQPYRFVGYTYLTVIILYVLFRAKSYYTVGLYPVLFAMGSVYLEKVLKKPWQPAIALLIILRIVLFLGIVKYMMPFQSPAEIIANREKYEQFGLLRWEDGKNHQLPQDFADMLGWKEIAAIAFKAYNLLTEDERGSTLIFTENYGQVGAINYYNRYRLPEAFSFNTDYLFWLPDKRQINNMVYVGHQPDWLVNYFKHCQLVGTVQNEYCRERGTAIYLLKDANDKFQSFFDQIVRERRASFDCF